MRPTAVDRRTFLKMTGIAAGVGLTLAVAGCEGEQPATAGDWRAWVHLGADGSIVVYSPRLEMGQGILTAVGMLVAEELDVDADAVDVRHAPLDLRFGNQITENSDSVRAHWQQLRELGAAARAQLVLAAAQRWGVAPAECTTARGYVRHAVSYRAIAYAELAEAAAALPLPAAVVLKRPEDFRLLGRPTPRNDLPRMVDGSLKYTADVAVPGALAASIVHSPMPGGRVGAIDDRDARASPKVTAIVNLGTAVAVVAADFWSAEQGCRKLVVEWTAPSQRAVDEAEMWRKLDAACAQRGETVIERGEVEAVLATGRVIERDFFVPYQAHAPMEPMVCIADVRSGGCEVWAPTQSPWTVYRAAFDHGLSPLSQWLERIGRKVTDRAGSRVKIHSLPMGGGFGRRLEADFAREAVQISKAVGAPVKLLWTREQDIRNDFYRPASRHRVRAALDDAGGLAGWSHRIAGSGILGGGEEFPYDCEHLRIESSQHEFGVPTGSWRSTAHTPNAFVRECMFDELAAEAGIDPLQFRLAKLDGHPRMRRALELAADRAGWGTPLPAGRARGLALHPSKESFIAQVAEVAVAADKTLRVLRVVCAVDCGLTVNPDTVRAQIEGAIVFGLTAALKGAITIRDGTIAQHNFDDYPLLRMNETPSIEVHLIDSAEPPGGIGEPGVPPVAPAVANAVFAATGTRVRSLPIVL